MRIDLYLKASRLIIRRTLAQTLCDAGVVLVNGVPAKSSRAVKVGDQIVIPHREGTLAVRVRTIPTTKQTSREDAAGLYEVIGGEPIEFGNTASGE